MLNLAGDAVKANLKNRYIKTSVSDVRIEKEGISSKC